MITKQTFLRNRIILSVLLLFCSAGLFSQSIAITGNIDEGNEAGDSIMVTLSQSVVGKEKFFASTVVSRWTVNNLPAGVTVNTVIIRDTVHATIILQGTRTTDYDADITNVNVQINNVDSTIIKIYPRTTLTSANATIFHARIESATISGSVNEGSENGNTISVTLTNDTFTGTTAGWTVSALPPGVSFSVSAAGTSATITFIGNRNADYDADISANVVIPAGAINSNSGITSNTIDIFNAIIESAAITGTIQNATKNKESDIIAGGSTIIITLTGAQWHSTIDDNNTLTEGLLDAFAGNGDWSRVRSMLTYSNVVRNSNTVVTITLPAVPLYYITTNETVTATIPDSILNNWLGTINASPNLTIVQENIPVITISGTIKNGTKNKESDIKNATGSTIVLTISGDEWVPTGGGAGQWSTATQNEFLDSIKGNRDWADVRAAIDDGEIYRDDKYNVSVKNLPAIAAYMITSDETLTITIPASATLNWKKDIHLSEKLTILAETSLPTASIVGAGERCAGTSVTVPLYIVLTGQAPWDIKYKINAGADIAVSGIASSPHVINATTAGSYTISYLKDNKNLTVTAPSSRLTGTGVVTVNNPTPVTIIQPSGSPQTIDTVAQKTVQLKGSPTGGIFTGPGVTSNDSIFHSTLLPVGGPYQIIYSYTNTKGCKSADTSIFNTSSGAFRIDYPGNKTQFCHSSVPVMVTGVNNIAVTGSFQFMDKAIGIWEDPGPGKLIENAGANLINVFPQRAANLKKVYTIRYFFRILLPFPPIPPTYNYIFDISSDFTINVNPAGLDFDAFTERCINADDTVVSAKDFIPGDGFGFFYYQEKAGVVVNNDSVSGRAVFRPSVAGADTHDIRYYFRSKQGCISDTTVKQVIVNPKPVLNITMFDYYNTALPVDTLRGIPAGPTGYFSPSGYFSYDSLGLGIFKQNSPGDYDITYSYVDVHGCYNDTTRRLTMLNANADILGINNFYCYYGGQADTLKGTIKETKGAPVATGFEINHVPYLKKINDSTIIINPDSLPAGADTVDFIYTIGTIPFRVQRVLEIDSIGDFEFGKNLDTTFTYCRNENSVDLSPKQPTYGGIGSFGFTGTGISGEFFDPKIAAVGNNPINCIFTRTSSGCKKTLSKIVFIKRLAHPKYTIGENCITGVKTDSTIFINQTADIDSVSAWSWNFGDVGSGFDNLSSRVSPKHYYRSPGHIDVKVSVTHVNGCPNDTSIQFSLGQKPIVDFYWVNDCYTGDSISFVNSTISSALSIDTYFWNFFVGVDTISDTLATKAGVNYKYTSIGDYRVDLLVETSELCRDTMSKVVHLRPTIRIADSSCYSESFNKGMGDWTIDPKSVNSTWEFGCKDTINWPGDSAFYTKVDLVDPEKSYINGPCFDFRGLERPMIKMNIQRSFERNRNGAVLQYSTDNGTTWKTIGANISDGVNWYNSFNIMQGAGPGDQGLGWTNNEGLYDPDETWVEAKQLLNELIDSSGVRFRIGYASYGELQGTVYGFAFDNIWIGERSRKVLIEHMTNNVSDLSVEEDYVLNDIIQKDISGKNIIDIRYHLNYPYEDQYYMSEPSAPSTRSLYYGVMSTPYSMLDGGVDNGRFDYKTTASELTAAALNTRMLIEPEFRIFINSIPDAVNLKIQAKIVAMDSMPKKEISLHMVVVEKEVTAANGKKYFNVVRQMLPDPAGTSILRSWKKDDSQVVEQNWTMSGTDNPSMLKVIVFVQDEKTKEVLQAEVFDSTTVFSRLNKVSGGSFDFTLFPNPASDVVNVMLNVNDASTRITMGIYDVTGRLVKAESFDSGIRVKTIDVTDLAKGMYMIKISDNNKSQGVQKLVIE